MASFFGRAPIPAPSPAEPAAIQLATITGRVDQAIAQIDEALRVHGRDRRLADVLLDVRDLLRPPERPS